MENRIGNSPNFGALHMPSPKAMTRKFGEKIGGHVNKLRPALEEMAKDADIYLKPTKYWFDRADKSIWSIEAVVLPKGNPVINKLKSLYHYYSLKRSEHFDNVFYNKGKKFTGRILETVGNLKDRVIK